MAANKPRHITDKIRREDFEAGGLKPASYSAEDISAALVDHLSRDEPSPRQLEALRRFKYDGGWSISQPDDIQNFRKFFEIFDDFFFHGLLRGYCTLELFQDTHKRLGRAAGGYCDYNSPGSELDYRFKLDRPYPHIAIYVSD
jgi:hypothetical protein